MNPDELEPLGESLRQAGKDTAYPPTPRLAARVRAELEASRVRPARGFSLWAGLGAAALALLLVFGVLFLYNVYSQQTANAPKPGIAFTANLVGDSLSAVDLGTNTLRANIAVGDSPWGMVVSPDGKRIFVSADGGIAIVDAARLQRTDFIPLPPGFVRAKVALSADQRILLVAGPSGNMRLIDMPTRGVLNEFNLDSVPYDIKLSPDGHFGYVLSQNDGSLVVVDVQKGEVAKRFTFSGRYAAYFMGQSPDGRTLYVPRLARSEIWLVDTQTNQARGVLTESKAYWQGEPSGGVERGVTLSHDGKRMFIALTDGQGTGGVSILDTQDFHEITHVTFTEGLFGVALNPDGSRLLATVPATSRLLILDAATLKSIADVEVDTSPYRVVVAP